MQLPVQSQLDFLPNNFLFQADRRYSLCHRSYIERIAISYPLISMERFLFEYLHSGLIENLSCNWEDEQCFIDVTPTGVIFFPAALALLRLVAFSTRKAHSRNS